MPVLMLIDMLGATTEQYDELNEIMGIRSDDDAPDGLIEHVAGSDGTGLTVIDVWESEEALGRFVEGRLRPALEQAGQGSDSTPRVLPVHNRLPGSGSKAGVIALIEIPDAGPEAYDQMASTMEAHQEGNRHPGVSHTAAKTEGGGVLVADVWESDEVFGRFAAEQIGPAGAKAGIAPVEPRFVPVHNHMRGRTRQPAG